MLVYGSSLLNGAISHVCVGTCTKTRDPGSLCERFAFQTALCTEYSIYHACCSFCRPAAA